MTLKIFLVPKETISTNRFVPKQNQLIVSATKLKKPHINPNDPQLIGVTMDINRFVFESFTDRLSLGEYTTVIFNLFKITEELLCAIHQHDIWKCPNVFIYVGDRDNAELLLENESFLGHCGSKSVEYPLINPPSSIICLNDGINHRSIRSTVVFIEMKDLSDVEQFVYSNLEYNPLEIISFKVASRMNQEHREAGNELETTTYESPLHEIPERDRIIISYGFFCDYKRFLFVNNSKFEFMKKYMQFKNTSIAISSKYDCIFTVFNSALNAQSVLNPEEYHCIVFDYVKGIDYSRFKEIICFDIIENLNQPWLLRSKFIKAWPRKNIDISPDYYVRFVEKRPAILEKLNDYIQYVYSGKGRSVNIDGSSSEINKKSRFDVLQTDAFDGNILPAYVKTVAIGQSVFPINSSKAILVQVVADLRSSLGKLDIFLKNSLNLNEYYRNANYTEDLETGKSHYNNKLRSDDFFVGVIKLAGVFDLLVVSDKGIKKKRCINECAAKVITVLYEFGLLDGNLRVRIESIYNEYRDNGFKIDGLPSIQSDTRSSMCLDFIVATLRNVDKLLISIFGSRNLKKIQSIKKMMMMEGLDDLKQSMMKKFGMIRYTEEERLKIVRSKYKKKIAIEVAVNKTRCMLVVNSDSMKFCWVDSDGNKIGCSDGMPNSEDQCLEEDNSFDESRDFVPLEKFIDEVDTTLDIGLQNPEHSEENHRYDTERCQVKNINSCNFKVDDDKISIDNNVFKETYAVEYKNLSMIDLPEHNGMVEELECPGISNSDFDKNAFGNFNTNSDACKRIKVSEDSIGNIEQDGHGISSGFGENAISNIIVSNEAYSTQMVEGIFPDKENLSESTIKAPIQKNPTKMSHISLNFTQPSKVLALYTFSNSKTGVLCGESFTSTMFVENTAITYNSTKLYSHEELALIELYQYIFFKTFSANHPSGIGTESCFYFAVPLDSKNKIDYQYLREITEHFVNKNILEFENSSNTTKSLKLHLIWDSTLKNFVVYDTEFEKCLEESFRPKGNLNANKASHVPDTTNLLNSSVNQSKKDAISHKMNQPLSFYFELDHAIETILKTAPANINTFKEYFEHKNSMELCNKTGRGIYKGIILNHIIARIGKNLNSNNKFEQSCDYSNLENVNRELFLKEVGFITPVKSSIIYEILNFPINFHRLQNACLLNQFKNEFGLQLCNLNESSQCHNERLTSGSLLLQALTPPAASPIYNYENLEFLGDIVLKYITTNFLVLKKLNDGIIPDRTDTGSKSDLFGSIVGDIVQVKDWYISNKILSTLCIVNRIDKYILKPFVKKNFIPPNLIEDSGLERYRDYFGVRNMFTAKNCQIINGNNQDFDDYQSFVDHRKDIKLYADVIEAITGAIFLESDLRSVIVWFYRIGMFEAVSGDGKRYNCHLSIDDFRNRKIENDMSKVSFVTSIFPFKFVNNVEFLNQISDEEIDQLQLTLGYNFINLSHIEKALVHSSYTSKITSNDHFNVLELIGDSVLDLVVAKMLFDDKHYLTPLDLHSTKKSYVNNNSLGSIVRNTCIVKLLKRNAPVSAKGYGDIFEAIVGAILVDLNWDFKKFEEVYNHKIKQLVDEHQQEVNYN